MDGFVFVKGKKNQSLEMVKARIESGLSIREWCEIHGIPVGSYDYHASKLRKLGLYPGSEDIIAGGDHSPESASSDQAKVPSCTAPVFSQVELTSPLTHLEKSPEIIVECGAFKITVGHGVPRDMIKDVLEVAAGVH